MNKENVNIIDVPLRPDFLARVIIPNNLTVREAQRLGAMLLTLAVDISPRQIEAITHEALHPDQREQLGL